MGNKRPFASSVLDKDGDMWVLGGAANTRFDKYAADSTEIYQYQPAKRGFGGWRKGFPLPQVLRDTGISQTCTVKINSTHIFMAGGYAREYDHIDSLKQSEQGK